MRACVCATLVRKGSKRPTARTSATWSLTSSTPDGGRGERGGRGGRKTTHGGGKVGTNPPSHGQTRPGLHPSLLYANQSQGCQLRSTCTPPARKPLPDKSPLITRLCRGAATDASAVLSSVLTRWERLVYVLKSSCDTEPKPQKFNQPLA